MPMRLIVSSCGSIMYHCVRYMVKLITPMVGKTTYHINNSYQCTEIIKDQWVEEGQELWLYDVTALFTSVPVDKMVARIPSQLL